ncbi:MAG TPA: hypothetical protein VKI19_00165 [Acidimicrobiales bacterium]|nr:hypothetical protein [Acidimicrobiales bacterium]
MSSDRRIASSGLSIAAPAGWEATIYRRPPAPGEITYPVVHAATVPMPTVRGDYGGGLVELLGPLDVFVGILEFGPAAAQSPLFRALGAVPGLTPDMFRARQLQRTIIGQAGVQRFFTVHGRAFCLYGVIGSMTQRTVLADRANQLVASFQVEQAA